MTTCAQIVERALQLSRRLRSPNSPRELQNALRLLSCGRAWTGRRIVRSLPRTKLKSIRIRQNPNHRGEPMSPIVVMGPRHPGVADGCLLKREIVLAEENLGYELVHRADDFVPSRVDNLLRDGDLACVRPVDRLRVQREEPIPVEPTIASGGAANSDRTRSLLVHGVDPEFDETANERPKGPSTLIPRAVELSSQLRVLEDRRDSDPPFVGFPPSRHNGLAFRSERRLGIVVAGSIRLVDAPLQVLDLTIQGCGACALVPASG